MGGPVVAGVDDRPASGDAVALATTLCEQIGTGLVAAYVPQSEERFTPYDHRYQRELRDRVGDLRRDFAPALERVPPGRRCELRAYHATTPARGLSELAASERGRVLVVGSSHRTPAGRVLVGTTGARLLVAAPCPVAVAPHQFAVRRERSARTVGVAVDDCRCSEVAVARARGLAADLGAELMVLSVAPHHGQARSTWQGAKRRMETRVDALLERSGAGDLERVMLGGAPVKALAAASRDLDLLVVGCRRTGGVAGHPTLKSVSRRLMATSACPLVVVPEALSEPLEPAQETSEAMPA